MKFYDCKMAINPRRVRFYMAEKNIEIPSEQVDIMGGENLTDEFREISYPGTLPVLVTEEGTHLTQVVAIVKYLEDKFPDNPLLGRSTLEKALVREWMQRILLNGTIPTTEAFRNGFEPFKDRAVPGNIPVKAIPELVDRGLKRIPYFFKECESHLKDQNYFAGENLTMADIDAICLFDMIIRLLKIPIPDDCPHLKAWHEKVSSRPAAAA